MARYPTGYDWCPICGSAISQPCVRIAAHGKTPAGSRRPKAHWYRDPLPEPSRPRRAP